MRPLSTLPRLLSASALCLAASLASAAPIGAGHLTASTSLGQYLYFSIDQLADGITADWPFNGYASGIGSTSGRITLALDQAYDLDSFDLWNDINILNEGVRSFRLVFEDAAGSSLGSTGVFSAVSQYAAQHYSFGQTFSGVRKVHLDVLSASLQIEIRELAFNGVSSVSAVPEPSMASTLLLGLAALAGLGRRLRRPAA